MTPSLADIIESEFLDQFVLTRAQALIPKDLFFVYAAGGIGKSAGEQGHVSLVRHILTSVASW